MKLQRLVVDVRGAVEGYLAALTDVQTAKEAYTRACHAFTDEDAAVKNRYNAMQYRKPCHYDDAWFDEHEDDIECQDHFLEGSITSRGFRPSEQYAYVVYDSPSERCFCWLGHP